MSNEENLRAALQHLIGLEEHNAFYENYVSNKEIKTSYDLDEFFNAFKLHLSSIGKWNDDLELTLKIIKEQSEIVKHQKSNSPLFSNYNSVRLSKGLKHNA